MDTNRKTDRHPEKETGFSRIEKMHPLKTFMFFGLVGSTVFFLSFSFLYFVAITRSGMPENFTFPKIFTVSTVLMLIGSFLISGSTNAFRNDSIRDLKITLIGTLILGVLFCAAQAFGFYQMYEAGFFLNSGIGVAYLYVIAIIHLLHVAGGMIFITSLTSDIFSHSSDIVKSLLYFTDENQLTKLQLAAVYWHFIDALWVLLFFMFLFSF
jgi:cytochrome c oxidase subunit 3